ncbi:DUF3427 domain-containing protein [Williamsia sp. CHRR-6]|uniref:DUF3427 domain-containing protein n=1 Tax=Williamsia sp. CHRR-6 TaxID=2835871 RepID=UPI001BDA39C4|nr:DUF3427 domain-containing protein [Williamsia sp. CHRR-6]MBT0566050.1 DUF3427 domain-containing protein [Williamsia sp. CHRR-6]
MTDRLPEGLYESVVSRRLLQRLAATHSDAEFEALRDDAATVLSRHIAEAALRHLTAGTPEEQRVRANEVLAMLDSAGPDTVERAEVLRAIRAADHAAPPRPQTPLADVTLLTNARGEPNMAGEVAKELASADHVDLLCAFIRFAGITVLDSQLRRLRDRGITLRVLTTTYRGATERRALDALVDIYGAQVKIRYETASTKLHAKAWLFRRDSGFHTGYVGSSNLSRSAMVDGLEWNVRISGIATPTLIRKFEATFDTYWNDPAFVDYNPAADAPRLDRALHEAGGSGSGRETLTLSGLDVMPFPHQERILETLAAQRAVHDSHANLVVAATGTGKTVVAALDFRALADGNPASLSLLFVAHRREILEQSLRMYREVLGEGTFGELLVDGQRPSSWRHVFASIQSLTPAVLESIAAEQFDVVVIDEFHHAAARTYRRLLNHLQPRELLGLTATPERADGTDILGWFGGRTAYELRLWDALEQDLLCPFHYFGVADNTDLTAVAWSRGDYVASALSEVYTGNDARVRMILKALQDRVADVSRMRALGFCVSVKHAEFMADAFTRQGVESRAVTGDTPSDERAAALAMLREGSVQCLFAVDVFNEGLDIPSVDTLLLLRPTQSPTIFLQQLGRGLRRSRGKAVVTVLDFIGMQRAEFRFDAKFLALSGSTPDRLAADIADEFPYLPGGSRIVLDRVAQETVLGNLRTVLRKPTRKQLVQQIRSLQPDSLATYLAATGTSLVDVYCGSGTRAWTPLLRDAGLPTPPEGPAESELLARMRAFTHIDDHHRAAAYLRLMGSTSTPYEQLSAVEQALARMLIYLVWPDRGGFADWDSALRRLRAHPAIVGEAKQIVDVTLAGVRHIPETLPGIAGLATHAHYRREEVLAAIGFADLDRKARGQAGGVTWSPDGSVAALFVNFHKAVGEFTPSTMYRDFPISRELFHWESPNTTTPDSETGQRYVRQRETGRTVLLFVRDRPTGPMGANPFLCLGPVDYVSHEGERPIAITWKLQRPMPADTFASGSVIAS